MGEIRVSKTTGAEFISIQLLKFVANPNPIAATITAFCDGINTSQVNNIIEVLNELNLKIDCIERQIGIKPYIDIQTFTDDILPILQKSKDEFNAQKRKLYATFLAACIHPDSLNCSNKLIFANYLDRLDYFSIYILNAVENYIYERQLVEKIGSKYNSDMIPVHLLNLKYLGLVDEIDGEEYMKMASRRRGNIRFRNPERVRLYKRSRLGSEFLNFMMKGITEN